MIRTVFFLLFASICTLLVNAKTKDPYDSYSYKECRNFNKLSKTLRKDCKTDSDCFVIDDVDCGDFAVNIAEKTKITAARERCKKVFTDEFSPLCDQQRPHDYKCKNQICEWTPL
jgi:hypothetical protein